MNGPRIYGWWFLATAVLAACAWLSISGCYDAPFLHYDDHVLVRDNHLMREAWYVPFQRAYHTHYIPLTTLSYKLNFAIFGGEATWSFRLVNALLHAGSALWLLGILRLIGLRPGEALFVAAAWAVHPLCVESTAWITQRNTVLAGFFGLAGLWMYLRRHGHWPGLLGGAAGLLLALMSKPTALGFIPLFFVAELLGGPQRLSLSPAAYGREAGGISNWTGMGPRLAPIIVLGAIFSFFAVKHGQVRLVPPPGGYWYTALTTDLEIFARYAGLVFSPHKLSALYGVEDIVTVRDARLWIYVAMWVVVIPLTVLAARHRRRALFGWGWFLGALVPHLNMVGTTFLMQDRYLYVAFAGLLIVFVEIALRLAESTLGRTLQGDGWRVGLAIPAAAMIGALAFFTVERSVLWRHEAQVFEDAVTKQPGSAMAHLYFAQATERTLQRFLSPTPEYDPDRAYICRKMIVEHGLAAQACPDYYRYYAPLGAHAQLARYAAETGQPDLARDTLKGLAPPPPAPDTAAPEPHQVDYNRAGTLPMQWNGSVYYYQPRELADAYLALAEADLRELLGVEGLDPLRGRALAQRAQDYCLKAQAAKVDYTDAYVYEARAQLALHPNIAASATPADDRAWLDQARKSLADALPRLERFERTLQIVKDMGPPAPEGRARALGGVALVEAKLDLARRRAHAGEADTAEMLAQVALLDAQLAEHLEPTFGATLWVRAQVHLFLDNMSEKRGDSAGSWKNYHAARACYKKIAPGSAYFNAAQDALRALTPPPSPEPTLQEAPAGDGAPPAEGTQP